MGNSRRSPISLSKSKQERNKRNLDSDKGPKKKGLQTDYPARKQFPSRGIDQRRIWLGEHLEQYLDLREVEEGDSQVERRGSAQAGRSPGMIVYSSAMIGFGSGGGTQKGTKWHLSNG